MGARINFVFKDELGSAVVLYSHWGQTEWERDLAMAINHAKPRWGDSSYATRMIISYLMQDSILDEYGFGIYSITGTNYDLGEQTVVIDLINHTVTDTAECGTHRRSWDNFMQANLPVSATVGG